MRQLDPGYSVVVPAFNRAATSLATVESVLAQQTTFPFEVIVVDSGSTDDTSTRIQSLATDSRIRYVLKPEEGVSAARNAGIAASCGDVIAIIDDDVVVHPGWLQALADTYRQYPDAWCVGGRVLVTLPETIPSWFSQHSTLLMTYLSHLDRGDRVTRLDIPESVWGANFSVRREAIRRVGGFDTALGPSGARRIVGEETELCWRIEQSGGGVYYCGRAIVDHIVPASRMNKRSFRSRAYWQGRTFALLETKYDFIGSQPVGRALATLLKSWLKRSLRPGAVEPWRLFDDELTCRLAAGYVYQSALTRVGVRLTPDSLPHIALE